MLQSIGYSLLAVKVTVGLLSLLLLFLTTTTYGMNNKPSLNILNHARTVNLHFNQRMLYAHATAPSKEITNAILDQIMSPSSINNQPTAPVTSCSRGMKEDRRILQALLYISQGDSDNQCHNSYNPHHFLLHVMFGSSLSVVSMLFMTSFLVHALPLHVNSNLTYCIPSYQLISPLINTFFSLKVIWMLLMTSSKVSVNKMLCIFMHCCIDWKDNM